MSVLRASLAIAVTTIVACSGGPSPTQPTTQAKASASPAVPLKPVDTGKPKTASCTPDSRPAKSGMLEDRAKGVKALGEGRAQDALKAFDKVMEQRPSDIAAFTLRAAANADVADDRERAGRSFGRLKPPKLDVLTPPHKNPGGAPKGAAITLKRLTEDRHQGDWFSWLTQMQMKSPLGFGGEADIPTMFGQQFGDQTVYATYLREDCAIVRYGWGTLVLGQELKGMRALNLEPFLVESFKAQVGSAAPNTIFPEVRFAQVSGSTLVAELSHEGDGQKVKPDGFILAIDLEHDKPLWVSDASTGNSYANYMTATHYVTAFTDPNGGKLNVLDLATGDVVASEPLPYRVDYVVGKGTKVFAWGFEKVISFELSSAPNPAEAKLGSLLREDKAALRTLDPAQQCWLGNAVIALDCRDGPALIKATEQLPEDASTTKALRAAGDFLVARANGTAGIDLTEKEPSPAQYLATQAIRKDPPKKQVSPPKRFVTSKDPAIEPPKAPFMEAPTPLYSNMRMDRFPSRYGTWNVEGGFMHDQDTVLVYGRRFIVTLHENAVAGIIDLKPLLGESGKDATLTPAYSLAVIEGTLYALVNAQATIGNAPSPSYVVALDPTTGKILWRSSAGMLTKAFLVFGGEYLLTAQNQEKTGELQLLRMTDGQLVQSTKVKNRITDYGWDGRGALYVQTQAGRQFFALK